MEHQKTQQCNLKHSAWGNDWKALISPGNKNNKVSTAMIAAQRGNGKQWEHVFPFFSPTHSRHKSNLAYHIQFQKKEAFLISFTKLFQSQLVFKHNAVVWSLVRYLTFSFFEVKDLFLSQTWHDLACKHFYLFYLLSIDKCHSQDGSDDCTILKG